MIFRVRNPYLLWYMKNKIFTLNREVKTLDIYTFRLTLSPESENYYETILFPRMGGGGLTAPTLWL